MKRATKIYDLKAKIWNISIHALVKRATIAVINQAVSDYNFNPRPREEGDQGTASSASISGCISIHALVKRATIIFKYFVLYNIISIHALVKRATVRQQAMKQDM